MLKDPLVSPQWLAEHLDAPDLVTIDASWYLPDMGRDAKAEYAAGHIPGARFFDIDDVSDTESPLPHMLPSAAKFASKMKQLGIGDGQSIVVYDGMGIFSSARVWWMLRVFGVKQVYVLDGGLPAWKAAKLPLTDDHTLPKERQFTASLNHDMVRSLLQVEAALKDGRTFVLDARPPERFNGQVPEPRAGVRAGHMPGALNLPFPLVLQDGKMRSVDELNDIFTQMGIASADPVITSCGSGVTAAILVLALTRIGHYNTAIYDGSWAEWGTNTETEVV
ncbi:3-mercaptopyruvate sulfurtransferase [Polycladidibacter hongkongensis]|uniref:3-mercaptopyruvate sulfurtransferase n=1 Tax=Polycladidibacter hongkongensis TaxID=1647556 RepID=UPI0008337941|nr:3-mercaptopyruvate sulfurtransferase [Pseudovibrio hongkongensis]